MTSDYNDDKAYEVKDDETGESEHREHDAIDMEYDASEDPAPQAATRHYRQPFIHHKPSLFSRIHDFLKAFTVFNIIAFSVIIVCEVGSWNLSYLGAKSFVGPVIALVFATAVQLTIIGILYTMDRVERSISKLLLACVYALCFFFSVGSAYVTSYETSTTAVSHTLAMDSIRMSISDYFGAVLDRISSAINETTEDISQAEYELAEEEQFGKFSGKGPGIGPVYLEKQSLLQAQRDKLALLKEQRNAAQQVISDFLTSTQNMSPKQTIEAFYTADASLPAAMKRGLVRPRLTNKDESFQMLPHARALAALTSEIPSVQRQAALSFVPAVTLELIALIMGFVRILHSTRRTMGRTMLITRIRTQITRYFCEVLLYRDICSNAKDQAIKQRKVDSARVTLNHELDMQRVHEVVRNTNFRLSEDELVRFWQSLVLAAAQDDPENPGNVIIDILQHTAPLATVSLSGIKKEYLIKHYPVVSVFLQQERVYIPESQDSPFKEYFILNTDLNHDKYEMMLRCRAYMNRGMGRPEDKSGAFSLLGVRNPELN